MPSEVPDPSRRWKVFAVVSLGVFASSLDLFIVNIAFPDIQRDFTGTSLAGMSWILNAYAIVFAALLVPAGRIADRVGRKRVFLAGLGLFTAASALCAAAPSVELLVAARVLQAVGGAMMMPTSLGLLLPEFPPERRATAVGLWAAVGGVAAAAGPPIGGLLVQADWRWIFLVNVPLGVLGIVAGSRVLREVRDPDQGRFPDLLGAAFLIAGIASLTLAIVKGPDWGWASAGVFGGFAAAAVLVAATLIRSARVPAPVIELPMLRVRSFALANVGSVFFFIGFASMLLTGVLFQTGIWHESILRSGLQLAPGPFMAALFAAPAGRLADRFGQRAVGVPGALLFASGSAWWAWKVGATPDFAGELLPGLMLTGAGVGLMISTLSSAGAASLPPSRFATGTAILAMSRQIGSAIGVAIVIAILGTPDPAHPLARFDSAWLFMSGMSLAAGVACLALGRVRVAGTAPTPVPPMSPVLEGQRA